MRNGLLEGLCHANLIGGLEYWNIGKLGSKEKESQDGCCFHPVFHYSIELYQLARNERAVISSTLLG